MNAFTDAFLKKGIVTEGQVQKVENEKSVNRPKLVAQTLKRIRFHSDCAELVAKLNDLYSSESSRGYLLHLLRAFVGGNSKELVDWGNLQVANCPLCANNVVTKNQFVKDIERIFQESKDTGTLFTNINGYNKRIATGSEQSARVICSACSAYLITWMRIKMDEQDAFIKTVWRSIRHNKEVNK